MQEEHDGPEEDRSDPEGRGARPPGRCSRSSRRAPRSCGCSRPSPWSSAPRLRRRRPPPQIVLRSAIFLIRKGASRPPAGSAARARPGRARGPWGRQYYEVPSRWRRRGPVARGARGGHIDALGPLQVHVSHYGWRRREVRGVGARHGHDDGVDGVGVGGVRGPTASTGHEAPADVALLWLATPTPSSGPPAGRRSPPPRRTRRGSARWPCGARGSARPRSTPVAGL